MRFRNSKSVQAPLQDTWARLTDFASWERMVMQSGGTMQPKVILPEPGRGQSWDLEYPFRGKRRSGQLVVTEWEPNQHMGLAFTGTLVSADIDIHLSVEPSGRTMMESDITAKPMNLSGRLLLQTARLVRPRVVRAIDSRLHRIAREIEYHS